MRDLSGRIIENHQCPRCKIDRTVRMSPADECFCLKCGYRWSAPGEAAADVEPLDMRLAALFTAMDLKRLDHYRAAVRANFYTDELTVSRVVGPSREAPAHLDGRGLG